MCVFWLICIVVGESFELLFFVECVLIEESCRFWLLEVLFIWLFVYFLDMIDFKIFLFLLRLFLVGLDCRVLYFIYFLELMLFFFVICCVLGKVLGRELVGWLLFCSNLYLIYFLEFILFFFGINCVFGKVLDRELEECMFFFLFLNELLFVKELVEVLCESGIGLEMWIGFVFLFDIRLI